MGNQYSIQVGINDLASQYPEIAKEWDYAKNKPSTPNQVTYGSGKKVWWLCSKKHSYESTITHRTKGRGCPYCANKKVLKGYNDLVTTHSKIAREWHPTLNGNLTPYEITKASARKVWWLCSQGHNYETTVYNRISGKGCPYCVGKKVLKEYNDIVTTHPLIAKEWHPTLNDNLTPYDVTKGCNKKVWWLCNKEHSYEATINSRTAGTGCPYCVGKKVLKGYNDLASQCPDIAKEWHSILNGDLRPNQVTKSSNEKVWWLCSKEHAYKSKISHRTDDTIRSGCPYCTNQKVLVGYNDLGTTHPEIAKEWDYKKNYPITPQQVVHGTFKKVWWHCTQGHSYIQSIANKLSGQKCPYCSNRNVLKGYNDLATTYPELAREWHPIKNGNIRPTDVTKGMGKKVWWLCSQGHSYEASILSRTNKGTGCPYCAGSKTERLIYEILKKNNISFKAEKKFGAIKVKYYPYDVYIPSRMVIIEADGEQHFKKQTGYMGQGTPFTERVRRDNVKNEYCLSVRITILRIPYTYNPDTDKGKIEKMVLDFIEAKQVPQEILNYYKQYDFSNYYKIATELNEMNL